MEQRAGPRQMPAPPKRNLQFSVVGPDGTKRNQGRNQGKCPRSPSETSMCGSWNRMEPRAEPRQMPALPKRNLHARVVEPRGTKWNQGRNQGKFPHSPRETSMCGSWNRTEPSGTKGNQGRNQGRNQGKCPRSLGETAMCGPWNQVAPSGTKGGTQGHARGPQAKPPLRGVTPCSLYNTK